MARDDAKVEPNQRLRPSGVLPVSVPSGSPEAFVLACLDASLSQDDIVSLTGLLPERVSGIVGFLLQRGLLVAEPQTTAIGPTGPRPASGMYALSEEPALRSPETPDIEAPEKVDESAPVESSIDARRAAFARKLLGSSRPPPPSARTQSTPAAEALQSHHEDLRERAHEQRVSHFVSLAEAALSEADWIGAVNAYRIACTLDPNDPALAAKLEETQERAYRERWEVYVERGQSEASEGKLLEAAQSFEKAALGRLSPRLYEVAARCLLQGGGDLKHAAELAKIAVNLAPSSILCMLTLARVHAAAGHIESALAELARASLLSPKDEQVKNLIHQIKKGQLSKNSSA